MTDTHRAKRMFGQNFLTDNNIIEKIIRYLNPKKDQILVEIGPGLGALTRYVVQLNEHLNVIEVDDNLAIKIAQEYPTINVIHQDVLTVDFKTVASEQALRVFGNLPYNISTPLLFHLFDHIDIVKDMLFMLQKEVVDRICAKVNTKEYGRLSIMCQFFCQVEYLFTVSPQCFTPAPKVYSAIVKLTPRPALDRGRCNPHVLSEVVKEAFNYRRKTLSNALKKWLQAEHWEKLAINPLLRPENLSLDDFIVITNFIETL